MPVLLLAALLALAGCSTTGSSAAVENRETVVGSGDPILDFYQCLRDNGLDVPDPGQGEQIGLQGVDPDDPSARAVVEGCAREHLSSSDGRVRVGGNMGDNLADTNALIGFVDCLRDQGIDMADPDPDGRLSLPTNVDPQDPRFRAALDGCVHHLDGGGILIGQPGGGGGMVGRSR